MTMIKKVLLLSGLCLSGLLSAADPASILKANMHNLRCLLNWLPHNDDVALKSDIQSGFNKACADLEKFENKISENLYTTHHTWLHKEFLLHPRVKALNLINESHKE
jgi:hypothetical protein